MQLIDLVDCCGCDGSVGVEFRGYRRRTEWVARVWTASRDILPSCFVLFSKDRVLLPLGGREPIN